MKKFLTLTLLSLLVGVSAQADKKVYISNGHNFFSAGARVYVYDYVNWSTEVTSYTLKTINSVEYREYSFGDEVTKIELNRYDADGGFESSDRWNQVSNVEIPYSNNLLEINDELNWATVSGFNWGTSEFTAYYLINAVWGWAGNVGVWTSTPSLYTSSTSTDVTNLGTRDGYNVYKWNYPYSSEVDFFTMKVQFNNPSNTEGERNSSSGLKYATDRYYKDYNSDSEGEGILYSRTFASTNGSTVCLPFALNADEAAEYGKFYELKSADGDNVVFSSVEATEACVPYYFVPKADDVTISSAGKTIEFDLSKMDVTVGNGNVTFSGTLAATSKSGVYGFQGGNLVYAAQTVNIPEFRAYLTAAAGAKLSLSFEDETGINTISRGNTDNVYYDLQGRRVMNPTKGLFIVNGKKVIR